MHTKIINDPVHGFVNIPEFIYEIIEHRFFQRLSRIRQLGLTYMVYPGAQHTRFLHSLGAMHLMGEALTTLGNKGVAISKEEREAAMAAILLHDVGHAPFSHVLESTFVSGISHEEISLLMMKQINKDFGGKLDMAIEIFQDKYPRHFFHQLISGQLDVDRLDYLSRDCYFTGVVEGVIGAERIIKMMNVAEDKLCVEMKGIYSIEKFLIARRMMYWQVYLHKASIAAEQVLISLLRRAICLAKQGEELFASPSLRYFLYNNVEAESFDIYSSSLENYARFDDSDIYSALKVWQCHKDNILSLLSEALTDRRLFKVKVFDHEPSDSEVDEIKKQIQSVTNFTDEEVEYLCRVVPVTSKAYSLNNGGLNILRSDGKLCDVSEVSDILDFSLLSKQEKKYYLCYYDSRQYFNTQM